MKFIRCSPFLFDELFKLNSLFTFFTYLGIHVSTDEQNAVLGDGTKKGGDEVRFFTNTGRIVA